MEEPTPAECSTLYNFSEMFHTLMAHPIARGFIEWDEDGTNIVVKRKNDMCRFYEYIGMRDEGSTKKLTISLILAAFTKRGFEYTHTGSYTKIRHPLFRRDNPSLPQIIRTSDN